MITNARTLSLTDLRHTFRLRLNSEDPFFNQWLLEAPPLPEVDQQGLERLSRNYLYLSQEDPPLEEVVKLVVVSPLLDLAGFYQPPYQLKTEVGTTLTIDDDPDSSPIQGKLDIFVIEETFWVLAIEAKPARIDVTAAIPQLLTYLLSTPTQQAILYGLITNGREALFLKLKRGDSETPPQYSRSLTYRLMENTQERIQVLQGLKTIGNLTLAGLGNRG